jgi:predicted HTH transcriptional regulator
MEESRLHALIEDLRNLREETPWAEFKVSVNDPDRIGKVISAISNSARLNDKPHGYILWGVNDATHALTGTAFNPQHRYKGQPYEFWMAKQITPSIQMIYHETAVGISRVILLEIPAADKVTTKFQGRAYIRIGEATPPLADHPGLEAALVAKLSAFTWESAVAQEFVTGTDVLRLLDYRLYFQKMKKPTPESNGPILEALAQDGIIEPDVGGKWKILNLGALLFANKLSDFDRIKRKAIRIVRYKGSSKSDDASEFVVESGYVHGYDIMIQHLHAILPKSEEIKRAIRADTLMYPEVAIRELVANALIHQDVTMTGTGPMIDVFDGRLEITNPGAPLIEPERFLDSPPRSRNEKMASLLRRVGVCEERGTGVRKVVNAIELFQLPAPEFTKYDAGVRVTLFAPGKFREMDNDARVRACYQHSVLMYLSEKKMTNSTLRDRFGISKHNAAQVSKVIAQALERGLIKQSRPWSPTKGHYLPFWLQAS